MHTSLPKTEEVCFLDAPDSSAYPHIILGSKKFEANTMKDLKCLSLTYPEAAIQAPDGRIYIANALGFAVERVTDTSVQIILGNREGARHPSWYTDLFYSENNKLLVLDASNSVLLEIDTLNIDLKPKILFSAPPISDYTDKNGHKLKANYWLSRFDQRYDTLYFVAQPVIWSGQSQQVEIGPGEIFFVKKGHKSWQRLSVSSALNKNQKIVDIIVVSPKKLVVRSNTHLSLINHTTILKSIDLGKGSHHGAGIMPFNYQGTQGWLVGSHTEVLFVDASFQTVVQIPTPISHANIVHISSANKDNTFLITDSDRQAVFQLDLSQNRIERTLGNNKNSYKITYLAKNEDKLLMLDNITPRIFEYDPKRKSLSIIAGSGEQGYESIGRRALDFRFLYPNGMAAHNGFIYVSEANHRIVRIARGQASIFSGDIHPGIPQEGQHRQAARFSSLRGLAIDPKGRLLIVDQGNHSIWRIEKNETLTKIMGTGKPGLWEEGQLAKNQPLNTPSDIHVRKDGSILVADTYNHAIVEIEPNGKVKTFAGTPQMTSYQGLGGSGGDDSSAVKARLNTPRFISEDKSGNVYVADEFNHAIRKVTPEGLIYTAAGGKFGSAPDGSHFNMPGCALPLEDILYVCDTGNSLVWAFLQSEIQ